jgi:DNA processing protein
MTPKIYEIALTTIPGIGNILAKQLLNYFGSAENIFKASKSKLLKVPGIGEKITENILNNRHFEAAQAILEKTEREKVKLLFFTDKDYPTRLKTLIDAPLFLYYNGSVSLNASKVIAIVGTRNATEYGRQAVEKLVCQLSQIPDTVIVSGLAYGIDVIAHKAAMQHNIPTIGVVGHGIDMIYPASHKNIAKQMTENGGILTEYPFGTTAEPPHFPERNRIIAGMSDAVIVIEAAIKGGALITADIATSYNREVFAVPGNINEPYSEGCNNLIKKQAAHLITDIEDLINILNWDNPQVISKAEVSIDTANFNEEELSIFNLLSHKEIHIDDLAFKTQIPVNRLASSLLSLEFGGYIKALPGKRYIRAK